MSLPMTKIKGVPDSGDILPGMAHFAGTGPAGETCEGCRFFGLWRQTRSEKTYHYAGCQKFKYLTGKFGPPVRGEYEACKYWEKKTDARR